MSSTVPVPDIPTLDDIRAAARRIAPYAHRTPVMTCATLDAMLGARLFFKCENLQKCGAFKFRGAVNTVFSLPEAEAARGVATHSSGNHAAAVALAARLRGVPATVVMPQGSSRVKQEAVAGYGARIVFCGPDMRSREATLDAVVEESGAIRVHPYDDYRVIAGQGTAALELLEEVSELDAVVVPVGGGGLAAGTALAAAELAPGTAVLGAEPAAADDAVRSLEAGSRQPLGAALTIADGLRATVGVLTFPILRRHVRGIRRVSEAGIVRAMRLIWERMKLVVEPSAAVPLAALLEHGAPASRTGARIGVLLSGGNVDLDALPWVPPSAAARTGAPDA